MKRVKFNDEKEDIIVVEDLNEAFKISDYIGCESNLGNRFIVCSNEEDNFIYVKPTDIYSDIEEGQYFIFDTERELYNWILGEDDDSDHVN